MTSAFFSITGKHTMKRFAELCFALTLVGVFIMFASSCSSSRKQTSVTYDVVSPTDSVTIGDVVLETGDEIEIKFFDTPDLNDRQTIRPDGKISMPIAGEVVAAGKTPSVLTTELTKLFSKELIDPKLTVIVRTFSNRKIFVGGEVVTQGVFPISNQLTVYEGVLLAGGFNSKSAKLKNVLVIRKGTTKRQVFTFDLRQPENLEQFYLQPRDILYVPKKAIIKVDDWVDQYINSVIPKLPFYFSAPVSGL
jgi:polysaccharide export outer membrane protein